ncbi:MAG: glycosyltransferase [Pseudomonadota bacterium]
MPTANPNSETPDPAQRAVAGFVVIGRNEGDRLTTCLESMMTVAAPPKSSAEKPPIIYVDSGSSDDSVTRARALGVSVITLDKDRPFTAARARNEGYEALISAAPQTTHIMFIDGDCALIPGFVDAAIDPFTAEQSDDDGKKIGLVTGFTRERYPERSLYNRFCDIEWRGPVGDIDACGGIFMVSRDAFEAAGGFNPVIIAAEDDELCIRLRRKGFSLVRIDQDMCWHDANMMRFGQWWRRAERAGHAFAGVGDLHPGYFAGARRRVILWAGALPLLIALGLVTLGPAALLLLGLYGVSFYRTRAGLIARHIEPGFATPYAGFLVLGKFPNLIGMVQHWWQRRRGQTVDIVEYK